MRLAGAGADGRSLRVDGLDSPRRTARLRGVILLATFAFSVGGAGLSTDGGRTPPAANAILATLSGRDAGRPAPLPAGTPTLPGVDGHHILDYGLVLTRPEGHPSATVKPADAVTAAQGIKGDNLDAVSGPILAWVTDHSQPTHREPALCWVVALRSEAAMPTFGPAAGTWHTTVILIDANTGMTYSVLLGFA